MFELQIEDNLYLRLPHPKDAEELFRLTEKNRKYLRQWLSWVDKTKYITDSLGFINQSLIDYAQQKTFHCLIIKDDNIVGGISFNKIDYNHRTAEIGYWLSENMQKDGIMTKSVNALLNYGFGYLDLNRIQIRCDTNNFKSRAVAERLGFTYEATLRQEAWLYDRFQDVAYYSILKGEWSK